jgi:putative transposase
MLELLSTFLRAVLSGMQSHSQLWLENLALRHQIVVLQRTAPMPRLTKTDRLLWVVLQGLFSGWRKALLLVRPQTVLKWHRLGFRLYWRWKSRPRPGRPAIDRHRITLIRRMWHANPTWGSRRMQAELAKLGIPVSDSTVRKYRPKLRRASLTWRTFLESHLKEMVAIEKRAFRKLRNHPLHFVDKRR